MKNYIANFVYLFSLVKSTQEECNSSESSKKDTSQSNKTLYHQSSPTNSILSFRLPTRLLNKITSKDFQKWFETETPLNDSSNPMTREKNALGCSKISFDALPENSNQNTFQQKSPFKENNLVSHKLFKSNSINQSYSNNLSSSNTSKNSNTLISYQNIEDFSKTWNFKYIQKTHTIDSSISSDLYSKNFNNPLTKEKFISECSLVLIYQINFHKNYRKIKFIHQILNLIINEFNNDYKNASLFIIYISFITKGLKNYVLCHDNCCTTDLLQITCFNFIFSDVSIKNTIEIWKNFDLKFNTIKTGYDILISIGLYFYFTDGNEKVDRTVYSYKKFVKESLKWFFGMINLLLSEFVVNF